VHRHSDAATALWSITAIPPTEASWKWQCLGRAFLSVVLPVITAVPLILYAPYARDRSALIAIALLLVITALPISSCMWVLAVLYDGPETVTSSRTVIVALGSQAMTSGSGSTRFRQRFAARFRSKAK